MSKGGFEFFRLGNSFQKYNKLLSKQTNIILDQNVIIESKCFKYFSNSQNIYKYLKYLTDNYLASWMKDPNVIEDNQYQVLVHPKQWDLI